jgi:hypothetical protein
VLTGGGGGWLLFASSPFNMTMLSYYRSVCEHTAYWFFVLFFYTSDGMLN